MLLEQAGSRSRFLFVPCLSAALDAGSQCTGLLHTRPRCKALRSKAIAHHPEGLGSIKH